MLATNSRGKTAEVTAINEVSLLRSSRQTARIAIAVDGKRRLPDLYCDGAMVATAAGLNRLQPLRSRPDHSARRRVAGADSDQRLPAAALARRFAAARHQGRIHRPRSRKRPVAAAADSVEVANVAKVIVTEANDIVLTLLFDPEHDLEERILKEQFAP